MKRAGEFELIDELFRPLARAPGAFALGDDAARLEGVARPVLSKDLLVEGVHFRSHDPPDLIARKALRVNLSDLAAMGATPAAYLLGCVWGRGWSEDRIAAFAAGLSRDQDAYGLSLLGGDMATHSGAAMFSVTAIGEAPASGVMRRAGAQIGDAVYVSGTIGDAALGLKGGDAVGGLGAEDCAYLERRYLLPEPRLALGQALASLANACIDVSDGVVADLDHIADQSAVRIVVDAAAAPLSAAAGHWLELQRDRRRALTILLTGGDDYELAFTAPAAAAPAIEAAASEAGVAVTRMGRVEAGRGVIVRDASGAELEIADPGFQHRLADR